MNLMTLFVHTSRYPVEYFGKNSFLSWSMFTKCYLKSSNISRFALLNPMLLDKWRKSNWNDVFFVSKLNDFKGNEETKIKSGIISM